jgi:hypothetical protein
MCGIIPNHSSPVGAMAGLVRSILIVLLYPGTARRRRRGLESSSAAANFDRYARLVPDGDVVTVPEFEIMRLIELLKVVGAGS